MVGWSVRVSVASPAAVRARRAVGGGRAVGRRGRTCCGLRAGQSVGEEPVRVVAISDVHVDHPENMQWVRDLRDDLGACCVLAGDVSGDTDLLKEALLVFRAKYGRVFFTPGNHDLWLTSRERRMGKSSLDKLAELLRWCEEEAGVDTRPALVGGRVWVVPVLSWYHSSFDTEPDIEGWQGIPPVERVMRDFKRCAWPQPLSDAADDSVLAEHFDGLNGGEYQRLWDQARAASRAGDPVISFSHFLPHIELNPEKRHLYLPTLPRAIGSTYLGRRVTDLAPQVHIFGHTHFGFDGVLTKDGATVRYIQAALGSPKERGVRMPSLEIGCIETGPVPIYDGEQGWAPVCPRARWSAYYAVNKRRPELNTELSPWAAQRYRRAAA